MRPNALSADTALKFLPLFGSTLIFFSILKSYIFYATFGIRITNYFSFSEAILLFLNEVAVIALYLLLVATAFSILFILVRLFKKDAGLIDIFIPDAKSTTIHKLFSGTVLVYPLLYLLYAIIVNTHDHSNSKNFQFWLVSLILAGLLIVYGLVMLWRRVRDKKDAFSGKVFAYLLFISILFFYIWSLRRQLFLYHRNKINKQVTVWLTDKEKPIELTNKKIQYLGSTSKYLFCYDLVAKKAIVIDASAFSRIELGRYGDLPGFSVFDFLFH